MIFKNTKAQSLIEILMAITVFTIMVTGMVGLVVQSYQSLSVIKNDQPGMALLREGLEAVRAIRDRNFLYLATGRQYLTKTANKWSFSTTPEVIDNFYTRMVQIEDVYRRDDGNITTTPGTLDLDTKKVTVTLSWANSVIINKNLTLTEYFTNWRGSDHIDTTYTEFTGGTLTDTEVTPTFGPPTDNGQVKLGIVESASGFFSSSDLGEHADGVFVKDNYAYITNSKSQEGFAVVDVSDVNHPAIVARVDIQGKGQKINISNNYAYATVLTSNKGLAIINVTNPRSPSYVSSVNVGGYGQELDVKGNYVYVTVGSGQGLQVVNATNPASPSIAGQVENFDGIDVKIRGNYAFVVNSDSSHDTLFVIDISNPASPVKVAGLDFSLTGQAIEIKDHYAYLLLNGSSAVLAVIDISDPLHPHTEKEYSFQSSWQQDIAIHGNYACITLDDQNNGLVTVNISDPTNPHFAYEYDIQGKGTGLVANEDYIFATTETNNRGLVIIGATKQGFANSGNFVSKIFDTESASTTYKSIFWEGEVSPAGEFKVQIRTASTSAGINTATWIGADGTNSTYYTVSPSIITIAPGASGTKYFQYKAFFTGDGFSSPVLNQLKVNYVP